MFFYKVPVYVPAERMTSPHYRPPVFIHTFITCLALFTGKELFNDWLQLGAEVIAMEPALKKNLCAPINKIPEHDDDDNVGLHKNDDKYGQVGYP